MRWRDGGRQTVVAILALAALGAALAAGASPAAAGGNPAAPDLGHFIPLPTRSRPSAKSTSPRTDRPRWWSSFKVPSPTLKEERPSIS